MAKHVICLGECLVDRLFYPIENGPTPWKNWVDYPGGAPANVAAAIAKLGIPSKFVGCLGQDSRGDWLYQALEKAGVSCSVQRCTTAPTRTVLVRRAPSGERQFVGFSGSDPAEFADTRLTADWINRIDFTDVAYLVMGTLGLAYPQSAKAMQQAAKHAARREIRIIIDLNWRPVFWPDFSIAQSVIRAFITAADVLKLSREEAIWLFRTDCAADLCNQLQHCQAVFITDGPHGSTCATKFEHVSMPAFAVDAEDTTGAGDAFLGGVITQLCLRGWKSIQDPEIIAQILSYASAVGALTTLKPGAISAQPSFQEVKAFLYLNQAPLT